MKRVVAEMGGKNAIVVDADADLDDAVPAIVQSAFGYAGQKCSAASRVIVVDEIYDALVERLAGATELVPIGHPRDPATVVGPLIDDDADERVQAYQALAITEGRVVVAAHRRARRRLVRRSDRSSSSDDPRSRDRNRGDLRTGARGDAGARLRSGARRSRTTPSTRSRRGASRARRRTSNAPRPSCAPGNVYLNRGTTGAVVGRQPFGGFGLSGVGSKAGGPDYLLQFVEPRSVSENTVRQGFAPE